ncbi:MAG: lycopene cyclase domain-containing protein [Candidatus Sumerlaeia bacterium]
MIAPEYEYLFAIILLLVAAVGFLRGALLRVLLRPSFWFTAIIVLVALTVMDIAGIRLGWWRWPEGHILGPRLFDIPLEEFLVMFVVCLAATGSWEAFGRDMD